MKPTTLLWCATAVAACACTGITPSTDAEVELIADARQHLDDAPDRAADAAEAMLAENPNSRGARLLAAESSMRMAGDSAFGRADLHLHDAVRNFELGVDGAEDSDVALQLRMLAECHYQLGQFEQGSAAALRAARGFNALPGADNGREYCLARLVGARCDYRVFVAARQAEIDGGEPGHNGIVPVEGATLTLATKAAAGFADARIEYPAESTTQTAAIHQWLGQSGEVIKELERGLVATPQETAIHDAYIDWMRQAGQLDALLGAYGRFVREHPNKPVLRWYQGRARYAKADQLRSEGNFQGAIAAYNKSRETFSEYLAVMPQHRDATGQWLALCDLATARCATDTGDFTAAAEALFRAADASAMTTSYRDGQPQLADSYGNHFTGCAFAIHSALAQSAEQPLQRTLAFNETILQRHPDRWGFIYNNAALAARDLGVQLANAGDDAQATQLWERSYGYYEKAVELSPDDPRIVNDCGLMLIYHLDRDFDRARTLFDRAIKIGTEQLEQLPADADRRERELLEEAVGDAWQNIAVLLREHQGAPFADYKQFCEQAIKYFPYQRREAAALLRNEGQSAPSSTARASLANRLSGGSAAADQGDEAAAALAQQRAAIAAKVDAEDYDGALTLLDQLSSKCKDHAPYQLWKGEITWKLANQARDSGRKGTEFFYQDAVRALQRAVELDAEPIAPRQLLAQAQYDSGDTAAAAKTVSALLLHMQSQGGGEADALAAAHQLRANAAARAYAQRKQADEDDPELLTAARTSLRYLEQKQLLDQPLLQLWSATEQWAGAPAEAVNVYVRASARAPTDQALMDALVTTAGAQRQLPLAIAALQPQRDPAARWYLGKAQFLLADVQRQDGKAKDALTTLDAAHRSFADSMAANADYRNSCEQWQAMCLGKKGNIALKTDDLDNAEQWLLASARLRPDRIVEDLGLLETTKGGLLGVVDKYYRKQDLKKVEAICRAAAIAAKDDVDLQNNAGLFARDYGNQLERAGDTEAAQEMYEQSYKAYRRAQQLDPNNIRLRNDCALIAIYHLDRDWDESKQLLDSAIADGERMLKEQPPEDADALQQLDEAVGDCYENLALWHLKHSRDGEAAKAAATKSQQHYPGQRRPGARRHLAAAERLLQDK